VAARDAAGLFTTPQIKLDAPLATGYRGLVEKPFSIDALECRARALPRS
jgi:hypothetical protein